MTSYMLSGKPILASVDQVSATTRFIKEADCGISVNPDSVESSIEGFKAFANMTSERRLMMGKNSRKYAEKYLTREVNLQIVCDAIRQGISKCNS